MSDPGSLFIDIDGTILYQDEELLSGIVLNKEHKLIPRIREYIDLWNIRGWRIYLTTARPESMRKQTIKTLIGLGLYFDQLIMSTPHGPRIVINNRNSKGETRALAVNIDKNQIISNFNLPGILHE